MKKNFKIVVKYFKHISSRIISEDYFGIASEVSYMLTIGVFPFALFLTAVFGWAGKQFFIDKILVILSAMAPSDIIKLFKIVLDDVILFDKGGLVAFIGFFVTLFLASNVIAAVIKGLNRANCVKETRSFLYVRILSIVMVFVNALFLFVSINLSILGNVILNFIERYVQIPFLLEQTISILRWPLAFFLLFIMAAFNYYILPSIDFSTKRGSVVPGSLFFCTFWLAGSWVFSLYVDSLGTYNRVYGTLGAFAILMVWLYYTSMVLLIGGEINNRNLGNAIPSEK
ncbi:MAG: YihY/virulence factor BrkB family protein [Cyanobacteria bacterium SIG30]|nr:YihY/virulence factor BrkB family protein [Cyanobacteria bacterium SIG30]